MQVRLGFQKYWTNLLSKESSNTGDSMQNETKKTQNNTKGKKIKTHKLVAINTKFL